VVRDAGLAQQAPGLAAVRVARHADHQHRVRRDGRLHVVHDVGMQVRDLVADRGVQAGFVESLTRHGAAS
jgi:hypothetical protein